MPRIAIDCWGRRIALWTCLATWGWAVPTRSADDVVTPSSAHPPTEPQWIWAADKVPIEQELVLSQSCPTPAAAIAAEWQLAARDSTVDLYVNDEWIARLEDFGPSLRLDVRPQLRVGPNRLRLRARATSDQPAVQGRLLVSCADGTQHVWTTSPSWTAEPASGSESATHRGEAPAAHQQSVALLGTEPARLAITGPNGIDITPFDNYDQWKLALNTEPSGEEAFFVPAGFAVERLHRANAEEGSWVSLAVEPTGSLLIAREDQGLLRLTLSPDHNTVESVRGVPAAAALQECRGLAFVETDLYVNANNSKGLYRLPDADGDGEYADPILIREFPGSVGHGRNDLAVADGKLYVIHGDSVHVPAAEIEDLTSPAREARRGEKTSEGHLLEYDPGTSRWRLLAAGLRNPFGVAVHPRDGTVFTYDADAEHDMGAPWYRSTRIVRLQPGGDYGWRGVTGQWPPYHPDHADNAPPVLEIGKGSPTAIKFGAGSRFPERYQRALYVLDWAYGRVLAVHLATRGAGYTGNAELFLRGRPLNVTDVDFGPDGAMYLVTGGRKTQSALYRIRWTGDSTPSTDDPRAPESLSGDWDDLNSLDPVRRYHARLRLERDADAPSSWRDRARDEPRPMAALTALMALAAVGNDVDRVNVVDRVALLLSPERSASETLTGLRAVELALNNHDRIPVESTARLQSQLEGLYPNPGPPAFTPVGLGGPVNHRLAELLVRLRSPVVVARTMPLLRASVEQEERLHYARVLSTARVGWTPELRREYFAVLQDLESRHVGGRGLPEFLKHIRDAASAGLSDEERSSLGVLLEPAGAPIEEPLPARPVVRTWTLDDIDTLSAGDNPPGDRDAGAKLFHAAACGRCHRVGPEGANRGPDLTGVASRFSRADLLRSIIDPSAVVAEVYRNVEIVTHDGRMLTGQLVPSNDYRDTVLRLRSDPLRPAQIVEVSKSEIEIHRESPISPMPAGLLNTLSAEEIRDLLAYLQLGGQATPPSPTR